MATTVTPYFRYDKNSVTSPLMDDVLAEVELDDELYLLNSAVKISFTVYQSGLLGPEDNIKVVGAGTDIYTPLTFPAKSNEVFTYECAALVNWTSPDAYPTIQLVAVDDAPDTTYRVSLSVQFAAV